MAEEVRNEQGELLLPQSQYDALEPVNGAVYVEDSLYEQAKAAAPLATDEQKPDAQTPDPAAQQQTDSQAPQIDYDAILKEKTQNKFEKWDDLLAQLDRKPEIELSENSRKLFEAIKEGKEDELADILYQRKLLSGVESMSAEDVIKLKMQIDNPDYTEEDINDEYEQKFGVGVSKDDVEESEYAKWERRAQRKLTAESKTAKEFLSRLKDSIALPDFAASTTAQPNPEAENFVNQLSSFGDQFNESLSENIRSLSKLDLGISDKDVQFPHEYTIQDAEKAELSNKASNYWSYIQSRYTKDGKYDTQKLLKDIYLVENFDKVMKSAVTRAMNQAKVELVKGVANVQDTRIANPAGNFAEDQSKRDYENFLLG
jgi:hypothetical protein